MGGINRIGYCPDHNYLDVFMATLTPAQIYSVARSAGFPPETATKMTAIALKESGGNPNAYNGAGPDDSYGLWQINMIGSLGPARLNQFGLSDKSQLLDPLTNAKAAYAIWNGNDNNLNAAWAINRGVDQTRYFSNLPTAEQAAASVEVYVDPGSTASPLPSGDGFLSTWLPDWTSSYPSSTDTSEAGVAPQDNTMLYIGLAVAGVVVLLLVTD